MRFFPSSKIGVANRVGSRGPWLPIKLAGNLPRCHPCATRTLRDFFTGAFVEDRPLRLDRYDARVPSVGSLEPTLSARSSRFAAGAMGTAPCVSQNARRGADEDARVARRRTVVTFRVCGKPRAPALWGPKPSNEWRKSREFAPARDSPFFRVASAQRHDLMREAMVQRVNVRASVATLPLRAATAGGVEQVEASSLTASQNSA